METETLIVDRIEGEIAVCEQAGRMVEIPLAQISGPVKEGGMLRAQADGGYRVDEAATEERRAHLSARFRALMKP